MLNVLLQVSINGPPLPEADSIIEDATKVQAHYTVTFSFSLAVVVASSIQLCYLSSQTWLNDKSRYNLKRVNQPQQPPKENTELPRAAFFSAATQTDVVIDLNEEAEEEEQCKEQQAEMIVAESLGLAGEDCTEGSISDEDSGLDSVSEDEFQPFSTLAMFYVTALFDNYQLKISLKIYVIEESNSDIHIFVAKVHMM